MDNFKSKYPSFTALLKIAGDFAQKWAAQGSSIVQKISASVALLPEIILFIPQAAGLKNEALALKSEPQDIVDGIEVLVDDLGFTSEKAKAIIHAAIPVAENIVDTGVHVVALVKAIKA